MCDPLPVQQRTIELLQRELLQLKELFPVDLRRHIQVKSGAELFGTNVLNVHVPKRWGVKCKCNFVKINTGYTFIRCELYYPKMTDTTLLQNAFTS